MIRLRNCRRRKRQKTSVERLASGLLLPKLWLPMSPGYPCCCEECFECEPYCSGCAPAEMQITLGGTISSAVVCDQTDCEQYLTDYIVPFHDCSANGWWDDFVKDCELITPRVRWISANPYILRASVGIGVDLDGVWEYSYGASKPACDEPNNRSFTYTVGQGTYCDFSLVTCNVTAL